MAIIVVNRHWSLHAMTRTLFKPLVCALLLSATVGAQEPVTTYVETDGEATILTAPTHVEFLVTFDAALASAAAPAESKVDPAAPADPAGATAAAPAAETANSLTAGVDEAIRAFRKGLNDMDLHPVEFEITPPTIRPGLASLVTATARMRFSLAGFSNPDTGPGQFADLYDKLVLLSNASRGSLSAPSFEVDDKESIVRSAVTQATTNAYPTGDAIALALSGRIDSVEAVKVSEVIWNRKVNDVAIEPNLRQVSCTAKVHVTYAVHPPQP